MGTATIANITTRRSNISVFIIDSKDWRKPLIDYLEHEKLPNELRHQIEIWRRDPHFIYYKETLIDTHSMEYFFDA